ncbi:MAG: ribose 5-phosphate isomerase B [archaeon]|nr:ribose 5-phosphate isomerase B [archaeon]
MIKKIYIGSDHAGYETKEALQKYLAKKGIETIDLGTHDKKRVDYPDIAEKVSRKVAKDKGSFGLLVCGTGIGMNISANKIKGIRAANPYDNYTAKMARQHNDANVICVGGRTYDLVKAKKILGAFLKAKPSKEKRHINRIKKISKIEKKN